MSQTPTEVRAIFQAWIDHPNQRTFLNIEHNGVVIADWIRANGGYWSPENLDAAVKVLGDLASGGRLGFYHPPTVVQTAQPTQPTAQELEAEQRRQRAEELSRRSLGENEVRTEFDRVPSKIPIGTGELERIALEDILSGAVMEDCQRMIDTHRGNSHGQTYRQQDELKAIVSDLKADGRPAREIIAAVRRKIHSYDNGSIH